MVSGISTAELIKLLTVLYNVHEQPSFYLKSESLVGIKTTQNYRDRKTVFKYAEDCRPIWGKSKCNREIIGPVGLSHGG